MGARAEVADPAILDEPFTFEQIVGSLTSAAMNGVWSSGDTIVAVGFGSIDRSVDGGDSWTATETGIWWRSGGRPSPARRTAAFAGLSWTLVTVSGNAAWVSTDLGLTGAA